MITNRASPCLPSAVRDSPILALVRDGTRATVCYGADELEEFEGSWRRRPGSCLAVDATGAVVDYASRPPNRTAPVPSFELYREPMQYRVCERGTVRCWNFPANGPLYEHRPDSGSVSEDGRYAFVIEQRPTPSDLRELEGDYQIWGELFDVGAGGRIAAVKLTNLLGEHRYGDYSIVAASEFYGRRVIVGEYRAGPGAMVGIVDPVASRGLYLHDYHGGRLAIDLHTLLVRDQHTISLVDLDTFQQTPAQSIPGKRFDDAESSSAEMIRVGRSVLIAFARPAGVAVFDTVKRTIVTTRGFPICN